MQTISKKVLLTGSFGVGKTSLISRFVHSIFSGVYHTTIGVKIEKRIVNLPDFEVTNLIWDIAGEKSTSLLPAGYFLGAHGIIHVIDLTRKDTYENIGSDLAFVQSKTGGKSQLLIAANKVDLVSQEKLNEIVESMSRKPDFFTSAKNNQNVEDIFILLNQKMIESKA